MRDLAKDKAYLSQLRQAGYCNPLQDYAENWIAQFEAAQVENDGLKQENERLREIDERECYIAISIRNENKKLKQEIEQLKAEKFAPRPLGWW